MKVLFLGVDLINHDITNLKVIDDMSHLNSAPTLYTREIHQEYPLGRADTR